MPVAPVYDITLRNDHEYAGELPRDPEDRRLGGHRRAGRQPGLPAAAGDRRRGPGGGQEGAAPRAAGPACRPAVSAGAGPAALPAPLVVQVAGEGQGGGSGRGEQRERQRIPPSFEGPDPGLVVGELADPVVHDGELGAHLDLLREHVDQVDGGAFIRRGHGRQYPADFGAWPSFLPSRSALSYSHRKSPRMATAPRKIRAAPGPSSSAATRD